MVINRWQSVFLFISGVMMGLAAILPIGFEFGYADGDPAPITTHTIHAIDVLPIFIIVILAAINLFLDIFLYKNFRLQKMVNLFGILYIVVAAVIAAIVGCHLEYIYSGVALIFAVWARARINHDEKLLKSYDRIR